MQRKVNNKGNLYLGYKYRNQRIGSIEETGGGVLITFLESETKEKVNPSAPDGRLEGRVRAKEVPPWKETSEKEDPQPGVKDPYEGMTFKERLDAMSKKETVVRKSYD